MNHLRFQAPSLITQQKMICTYLKAVRSAESKKFAGLDETGAVNVACWHEFSKACIDMTAGER
jgi:hypothetical protein